ncbi:LysE family translocator [Rhodococcus sp. UNC363MFTsu5.1]|uniref:LysE family translocator n=1 Tax=Rhodococcus sp. UNC363MFTsu5.1 TaxID=1449069 RepID=UPI000481F2CD|nr:LysE family translocator [Rhodococcus sp. UNC363MFTsu5.1]
MTAATLLSFAGLCLLLALMPGPDSFLVLRYSIGGTRPGVAAAVGVSIGSLFWAVVVALGVAALLEQSASAYRVVKIAGGLYLLYLGVRALLRRRAAGPAATGPVAASTGSAFGAGVLSCALNPKMGLFYLAVVPQFLDQVTFGSAMTLGAVEAVVALVVMGAFAVAASRLVALLRRPKVTERLETVSAGILAALGVGTLASAGGS